MHQPLVVNAEPSPARLTWHGKDGHSTLIRIHWPETSSSNLTASTITSSPVTPPTPVYDPLESDSEQSDNRHTITIRSTDACDRCGNCDGCDTDKCLKCELKATDYEDVSREYSGSNLNSVDMSPAHSRDISYQNLNRLSAVSTSSNSDHISNRREGEAKMTLSHESSSSYSNVSLKQDELYECFSFTRPNYINLSSSTSKSSPGSPSKSPLKSTISITFRSPTKSKSPNYEPIGDVETPTNERDSVYEDMVLEKNLSIVEDASVPETDASLPTQQACQPHDYCEDLIILETPTESANVDVYSQVKFFKKSIEEVNAMIVETPERESVYENVGFSEPKQRDYENVNVDTLKICDKVELSSVNAKRIENLERDNGNVVKPKISTNMNVRELAIRFESPTEQKGPFAFDKFRSDAKYPTVERDADKETPRTDAAHLPPISPKTYKLSKNSNARSLDENAFIKEFGSDKDRRRSLEVKEMKKQGKFLPDLNLNTEEPEPKLESITPTTENKISLIQRFDVKKPSDLKNLIGFEIEKKLSRERIEKYKEERRNFLREKYSSQSFRSNPEQLTRIKLKKEGDEKEGNDRLKEELPKFERRNTVDLGQRMRFSLARSANNLDTIPSPGSPDSDAPAGECSGWSQPRKEKVSPSYNIRDMAAMFEQRSQSNSNG